MPSFLIRLILLILPVLALSACGDADADQSDVLYAGSQEDENENEIPCYWVSGNITRLTTGNSRTGVARAALYDGDTLWIGGSEGDSSIPVLWKNGERIALPVPSGATGFVSGLAPSMAGVIACGTIRSDGKSIPCFWRDYALVTNALEPTYSEASCIAINGQTMVLGGKYASTLPCIWTNDTRVKLEYTVPEGGMVSAVLFSARGEILAGGTCRTATGSRACIWKNGTMTLLESSPGILSEVSGATLHEGQLVTCGSEAQIGNDVYAAYWVETAPRLLPSTWAGSTNQVRAYANAVASWNGAIVVGGSIRDSLHGKLACTWVSGERVIIGKKNSTVNAIAIRR
ncbi:MAG TPA: hypothetical protein PK297_02165 [Spirochaetota bacterium]|nr:hypothetical protein [Spirochaetota bacterium]